MNTALERAKLHFKPMLNMPKTIHVPEWGDEQDGIFYSTALNLKERQVIDKMAKDEIEVAVEVIIRKLEDKDGNKVFSRTAKQDLMTKVDPRVIARVATEILGEDMDLEVAEKN